MAKAAAAAAMVRVRKEAAITFLKCAPSAMFPFVIAGAPVLWLIRRKRGYRKAQGLTRADSSCSADRNGAGDLRRAAGMQIEFVAERHRAIDQMAGGRGIIVADLGQDDAAAYRHQAGRHADDGVDGARRGVLRIAPRHFDRTAPAIDQARDDDL